MQKKNDTPTPPSHFDIELTDEIAEGIYSNLASITHSPTEFIVDFIKIMPNTPKAKVKSRIILTPVHAKRFLRALADNVNRFEQVHGKIQETEAVEIPLTFGGPTGQA